MKKIKPRHIFLLTIMGTFLGYICFDDQQANIKLQQFIYIDFVDKKSNQILVEFDLDTKKENVLLKKQLEDYPSTTYSKDDKKVFFTGLTAENRVDVFEKNIESSNAKQLRTNLNYVDFLEYNQHDNLIYMRVLVEEKDRNFHLATYNLETSEINVWNEDDKDTSVVDFHYNPIAHQVLLVTKSISEEFKNVEDANNKGVPPKPSLHRLKIYSHDGKREKEILSLNKFVRSASLSGDGNSVLINYKESIEAESPSIISEYKIKNHELTELLKESKEQYNISHPLYTQEQNGFYFIVNTKDNVSYDKTAVRFYDFKTKKISEIWSKKNGTSVKIY